MCHVATCPFTQCNSLKFSILCNLFCIHVLWSFFWVAVEIWRISVCLGPAVVRGKNRPNAPKYAKKSAYSALYLGLSTLQCVYTYFLDFGLFLFDPLRREKKLDALCLCMCRSPVVDFEKVPMSFVHFRRMQHRFS